MTTREEAVEVLVKKAAMIFALDAASLNENTRFTEDLNCKSVNLVQLSAALEDHFEIEVPYLEIKNRKTFGEMGDYISTMID